jgi:CRISPR/Cas system CSM-associated protein Csm3 (group 7 of RAMP superfamily)
MKKGNLKKEGRNWKISSSELKSSMTVPGDFGLSDDMDSQEIEFDNSKGPITLIRFNGKNFVKKQTVPNSGSKPGYQSNRDYNSNFSRDRRDFNPSKSDNKAKERKPARSPYNFIPLNDNVIASNGIQKFSSFIGLSGVIDIGLEVIQPLFIRGNDGLFSNQQGEPFIPGSSIRGLIKNLVNIVSYGKFDQFTNKALYRRSTLLNDGKDVKAGFMTFSNGKYIIKEGLASLQQESSLSNIPFSYNFNQTNNSCEFSTGKFLGSSKVWKVKKTSDTSIDVNKNIIEGYESDSNRSEEAVEIIKSLIKGKIVDSNEKQIGNVTVPKDLGIPVFYRQIGNSIISFGHAKYHRIPYSLTIGDHIIQNNISLLDFSESIFGTLDQSSKIFFEDAIIKGDINYELIEPQSPKILSSPKPTTYQHYLEQPEGIKTIQSKLNMWSQEGVQIRGHKNYWHRQTSSNNSDKNTWIETGKITKSNPEKINPLSPGTFFIARIRFENLTNEELGAILFVIDLPEGCCHKLGMGKPLGLGSVKISINTLKIIDRVKRYESLFDNNGDWYTGDEDHTSMLEKYKNLFSKYICENPKIDCEENLVSNNLWEISRLNDLKNILNLKNEMNDAEVGWFKRTRYMEIERVQFNTDGTYKTKLKGGKEVNVTENEFKDRPVLPNPSEVKNKDTYTEK